MCLQLELSPFQWPLYYRLVCFLFLDREFKLTFISADAAPGRVTSLQWYAWLVFERHGTFSPIIHSRALFQEFIVDTYLCVERGRLRWVAGHRQKLKADSYKNVADDLDKNIEVIGKRIVLPSSFIGGPRHMRSLYQDEMAMTRDYGPPSLFITMTANPNWPEIQNALKHDETLSDRPDIGVRVFKMKLDQLIYDLTKRHILGRIKSWVYVIEFQQRGLPHVHFLGILEAEDVPRNTEHVDDLVSAEIPDAIEEPILYDLVKTHMLHGPCGPEILSPCKSDTGCSKRFPKPFQSETTFPENGYPLYRRREHGPVIQKRAFQFDNSRVVPYNRYLLLRFQCHINIEIPHGIKAYKYLYKYVTKGHDRAKILVDIEPDIDIGRDTSKQSSIYVPGVNELRDYMDGRWISAYEGLFCFSLDWIFHWSILLTIAGQQCFDC